MRTDELRDVLHQHADQVRDQAAPIRITSVKARVGATRRRRHAKVAGLVVTVMVGAGLAIVPNVLDRNEPAPIDAPKPADLVGHDLPGTLVVGGFSYDYSESVESKAGERMLRLRLPDSENDRALAWASDVSDLSTFANLTVDGESFSRSTAGGFESGALLESGMTHKITLRLNKAAPQDQLGLAVYEQSDTPPAGATNGGRHLPAEHSGEHPDRCGAERAGGERDLLAGHRAVEPTQVQRLLLRRGGCHPLPVVRQRRGNRVVETEN